MTTRQYHRNSDLAFPKTADYASALTRSRHRVSDTSVWIAVTFGAIAVAIALIWD